MRSPLLVLLALLSALAAHAQTDVILRTNGDEVAGKVLSISPLEVRYVPAALATDTLRLAATDVFLIRYANGTRELLQAAAPMPKRPAASTPTDLLPSLSQEERRRLGRTDAAANYHNKAAFWGSLGSSLVGGPMLGLVAPAIISTESIHTTQLAAPQPNLLTDPAYNAAYRQEAQRTKRRQAWSGYGTGAAAWLMIIIVGVSSAL